MSCHLFPCRIAFVLPGLVLMMEELVLCEKSPPSMCTKILNGFEVWALWRSDPYVKIMSNVPWTTLFTIWARCYCYLGMWPFQLGSGFKHTVAVKSTVDLYIFLIISCHQTCKWSLIIQDIFFQPHFLLRDDCSPLLPFQVLIVLILNLRSNSNLLSGFAWFSSVIRPFWKAVTSFCWSLNIFSSMIV